jgi:hypothetical protein
MNTPTHTRHRFEFAFPSLDTLLQVEDDSDPVVIRASRDTFSAARKDRFLRELVAEGFVSDDHPRFESGGGGPAGHVRWIVDPASFRLAPEFAGRTRRFMLRLLAAVGASWLLLLGTLVLFR